MLNWRPYVNFLLSYITHQTCPADLTTFGVNRTLYCECFILRQNIPLIPICVIGWLTPHDRNHAITGSESVTFFAKPTNMLLHFFSRDDSIPQICSVCAEFYRDMCHPDINSRAKESDSTNDRHHSTIFFQPLVLLFINCVKYAECDDVVIYLYAAILLTDLQEEF